MSLVRFPLEPPVKNKQPTLVGFFIDFFNKNTNNHHTFLTFLGIHYISFFLGEYTINERGDYMYYGYGYPGYGYGYGYGYGSWVWAILIVLLILFLVFWTPGNNQRPPRPCGNNQ